MYPLSLGPQQQHLKFLPENFRPLVILDRRAPVAPSQPERFRYFQEEREYSKLAALSRNPSYAEIMIDNQAIELISEDEVQGSLHTEMTKDEDEVCRNNFLDMSAISVFLSLPLAGLVPFVVTTFTSRNENDPRKVKLQKR